MGDIEELRRRRLQQLARQQSQEQLQQDLQQREMERQIKLIVDKILTPQAKERLGNIRAARPEYARQIEILMIQLAQSGRLPKQIDDSQLREILKQISEKKRDTKISFR